MDELKEHFLDTDVANDIENPTVQDDPSSSIAGMPVL
jgi:NAD/NADP transhydrogenase beta subunit